MVLFTVTWMAIEASTWCSLMRLVLDVENTVTKRGGKKHLDPFEPTNSLVQERRYTYRTLYAYLRPH
mgnify:CR=1 FL=1